MVWKWGCEKMGVKYDGKTLTSATRRMELPFPKTGDEGGGTFCLRCLVDTQVKGGIGR